MPDETASPNSTIGDSRVTVPIPDRFEAITPVPQTDDLAVSFNQDRRLSFEESIRSLPKEQAPLFLSYNIAACFAVQGELNIGALEVALNELVLRHASLRASFLSTHDHTGRSSSLRVPMDGRNGGGLRAVSYRQRISEKFEALRVTLIDDPNGKGGAAERIVQEENETPFDYKIPPLMRATVVRQEPDRHLLILTIHHLAADLWSLSVLRKELSFLYRGLTSGHPIQLPPLTVQYHDFAYWQRKHYVQTESFRRSVPYWREKWEAFSPGELKFDDIPFAIPKPSQFVGGTEVESLPLDLDASEDIRRFAAASKVTLYMLFLTAFEMWLHYQTGKTTIATWGFFANRVRPGTGNTVGWFANAHALHLTFTEGLSGHRLLQDAREAVFGAFAHQELPVALLWRVLGRHLSHGGPRIFLESVKEDPIRPRTNEEVTFRHAIVRGGMRGGLNLRFVVFDGVSGITLYAIYPRDRFRSCDIRSFLNGWRSVAAKLCADANAPIASFAPAG